MTRWSRLHWLTEVWSWTCAVQSSTPVKNIAVSKPHVEILFIVTDWCLSESAVYKHVVCLMTFLWGPSCALHVYERKILWLRSLLWQLSSWANYYSINCLLPRSGNSWIIIEELVVVYFLTIKLLQIRGSEEVLGIIEELLWILQDFLKNSWKILQKLSGQGDRKLPKKSSTPLR